MLAVSAFGFSVVLAVLIALATALMSGRDQAREAGRILAFNLAKAATDSIARMVQSVDVVLASVEETLRERATLGEAGTADAVRRRLLFAPQIRQILVLDRGGRVIFDAAGLPPGRLIPEADGLFEAHQESVRPLVIGKPVQLRYLGGMPGGGQYLIPLSRTFGGSATAPEGLILAAVNPQYLLSLFQALEMGAGGVATLHRFDGTLLAASGMEAEPGRSDAQSPLFAKLLKAAEFGTFIDLDADGTNRISAYRMTLVWPLVIRVGLSEDTVMAPWREDISSLGLPVVGVAVAILVLTGFLGRLLVRRVRDEEVLLLSDMALSNVMDGVSITDALSPDNPVVYVNPSFERITGYPRSEIMGRNLRFLHAADAGQDGIEDIRRAVAEGGTASALLRNYRKDGSLFWNQLTVSAVRDSGGRIVHYVGVQRDMTQRVEYEDQLRRSLEEAARVNAELARFSEILAHHLQEPVRSIVSFTQILERRLAERLAPEEKEFIDYTVAGAVQLKKMLRDVERYLSLDRLPGPDQPISADAALDEAVRRLEAQMVRTGAKLDRERLPEVWLDQRRLVEVFGQLLDNALTYRHPDRLPEIVVSANWDRDWARFRLEDNGIGIAPEFHDRIFRVFERLDPHHDHDGTGIGLAMVYKIVSSAGGTIAVGAGSRGGTAVMFALPRHP